MIRWVILVHNLELKGEKTNVNNLKRMRRKVWESLLALPAGRNPFHESRRLYAANASYPKRIVETKISLGWKILPSLPRTIVSGERSPRCLEEARGEKDVEIGLENFFDRVTKESCYLVCTFVSCDRF